LALLHELGLQPLVHTYVVRAAGLYNALIEAGPVYQALLAQQVQDGVVGRVPNWISHLHRVLSMVQPRAHPRGWTLFFAPESNQPRQRIALGALKKALREFYAQYVQKFCVVADRPGVEGSRVGAYFKYVGTHSCGNRPLYLARRLPFLLVRDCLHFRLGAHHLQLRLGRMVTPPVPRPQRHCQRCAVPAVDDERHCLFHCSQPLLVAARQHLQLQLLRGRVSVSLADLFVAAGANVGALRKLVRFVAVCYRVARDCDGGEELVPVDLEADLAPQDFLDTFSSDSDA
jgi:hypothetical protein